MKYGEKVRLGHIDFINCLPLTYGLQRGGFGQGLDIVAGPPSMLNKLAVAAELAASPVSSIIYAMHSEKFLILPDVSISANGFLHSILLVSKRPIDQLAGAKVSLTAKSATSHSLLKIIMHHAYKLTLEYFVSAAARETEALANADAVLFIGDDALYAYHNQTSDYFYYDIGHEWQKLTGQAMVYALWVVWRELAEQRPDLTSVIYQRVTGGFAYGLNNLPAAVETMAGKAPFSSDQISNYLHLLNYRLTAAHQAALLTYYQLAQGMGLIDRMPSLVFAEVGP